MKLVAAVRPPWAASRWGEPPGIGNHYMTIAYLDGPSGGPSVIVTQGIYKSGTAWTFDWSGGLRHRWTYQHGGPTGPGTSAHEVQAYDLNGDGKEEVLFGGTILRPDGTMLWTLNRYNWGHVDVMTPSDLDPNRPGKEIFYAVEVPRADSPAVLVDAMTRDILWQRDGQHVHQGWAANIDASRPGDECRARDMAAINQIADGLLVTGLEGMWATNGTALSGRPDMHRPHRVDRRRYLRPEPQAQRLGLWGGSRRRPQPWCGGAHPVAGL